MSSIVRELRRARQNRRLGQLEWFEVVYRAYLVAFVAGGVVLAGSSWIHDLVLTPDEVTTVADRGPRVIGLAAAAALAMGLRSGSDGGPVALEAGDVHHLLLAPVSRWSVLVRPVVQRLRSMAFGGAVMGAIAGVLAAGRLPGSRYSWAQSVAAAGAAIGVLFVAVAVVAHALRLPRWVATALAAVALALQGAAAADRLPAGPFDTLGSLALWGMRTRLVDLAGVAVVVLVAAGAIALAGRLRVEPLVRRAGLVAQLRFAATMQDLRTVMLLRRQLRGEHARATPWLRAPLAVTGGAGRAIWRRGWRGLLRSPSARLLRMGALAVAAGLAAVLALDGTTAAVLGVGGALHLMGLDAVEPLSQEIDHPDRVDATPLTRGWVLVCHLVAPALGLVPFALLGAAAVVAVHPSWWPGALILAAPVTWAGAIGAAISVVRDAPDPLGTSVSAAIPPEFAGFTTTMRLVWPITVSVVGTAPILLLRLDWSVGGALRAATAALLVTALAAWWVRKADEWKQAWRHFLADGRAATDRARAG